MKLNQNLHYIFIHYFKKLGIVERLRQIQNSKAQNVFFT